MISIRPEFRPSRVRRAAFSLAFGAFIALAGGCTGGGPADAAKDAAAQAAIPVEVAPASHQSVTANYSGTATLEAVGDAQVVTKATGIILKILVEEGMRVQKGQLLAQLDDDAARNKLLQAQATLRKAEAAFDKSEKGIAKNLVPRSDFDRDKFDLETQRAVVAGAEIDVSYTRITAPIAGVIAKRSVKVGNLVQANQALFQIVDMDPLQAVLNVPERDLDTLKPGQSVHLKVDALPTKTFDGIVARVAPVVDATSGTFRATCEFRDTSKTLMPGMFGRIDVAYDQRHDALVVPRSALVEEDGESAVFVIEPAPIKKPDDKSKDAKPADKAKANATASTDAKDAKKDDLPLFVAKRRVVKTGYSESDRVEVRDGLKDGERVITIGRNAVRDGTEVTVLTPPPAQAQAAQVLAKVQESGT
jgi:membrane fusion protein, multidrug efflux system